MHPFAELSIPSRSVGVHWFEQNSYALKDSSGYTILVDPYFPTERPSDRVSVDQTPVAAS